MNTTAFLTVLVAVAVVGAGCSILFLGGMNDEITTKVTVGEGLSCKIDGKDVANGGEITIKEKTKLCVQVNAVDDIQIQAAGSWISEKNTIGKVFTTDSPVREACFTFELNHGKFSGKLAIINVAENDGNICPIHLKFSFDDSKVKVSSGGTEIANGDTFDFDHDGTVQVESKIGKVMLRYSGSWKNADGMTGGASGYNQGTSVSISIMNMMFFSDGYGDMEITVTGPK